MIDPAKIPDILRTYQDGTGAYKYEKAAKALFGDNYASEVFDETKIIGLINSSANGEAVLDNIVNSAIALLAFGLGIVVPDATMAAFNDRFAFDVFTNSDNLNSSYNSQNYIVYVPKSTSKPGKNFPNGWVKSGGEGLVFATRSGEGVTQYQLAFVFANSFDVYLRDKADTATSWSTWQKISQNTVNSTADSLLQQSIVVKTLMATNDPSLAPNGTKFYRLTVSGSKTEDNVNWAKAYSVKSTTTFDGVGASATNYRREMPLYNASTTLYEIDLTEVDATSVGTGENQDIAYIIDGEDIGNEYYSNIIANHGNVSLVLYYDAMYSKFSDAVGTGASVSGKNTLALGTASRAEGEGTIAKGDAQTVVGKFNEPINNALFVVGSGEDDEHRKNALVVLPDGILGAMINREQPSEDLDDFLQTGYHRLVYGTSYSHSPTTGDIGHRILCVFEDIPGAVNGPRVQLYLNYTTQMAYMRIGYHTSGDPQGITWYDWEQIGETDKTLSLPGAPADAKAVADYFRLLFGAKTENLNTIGAGNYYYMQTQNKIAESNAAGGLRDFIPCEAETTYTITFFNSGVTERSRIYVTWKTAQGDLISMPFQIVDPEEAISIKITSPANAALMHTFIYSTVVSGDTHIMVTKGEETYPYYKPPYTAIDSVSRDKLEKVQLEATSNLNTSIIGRYYCNSSGVIKTDSSARMGMKDYIPCEPSTKYIITLFDTGTSSTGKIFVAFKATDGTFINRKECSAPVANQSCTVTSPDNAAYMHVHYFNQHIVSGADTEDTSDDVYDLSESTKIYISKVERPNWYMPPSVVVDEIARHNAVSIPAYYMENMTAAIKTVRNNMGKAGTAGTSFVFITDTHWGYNAKNSPALVRYLFDHTNIREIVCGGDALDSGEKEDETSKGYQFMSAFDFAPYGIKFVDGNHDGNEHGHTDVQTDQAYWLTGGEIYTLFHFPAERTMRDMHVTEYSTDGGYYTPPFIYGYYDIESTNTRYLLLGAPLGSFGGEGSAQEDWISDQLTNNPDKKFILFAHFLWDTANKPNENPPKPGYTGSAIRLFGECDLHNNVMAIIYGHLHYDKTDYTTTGIPVIGTDTDAYGRVPNVAKFGTVTEQCFDAVTVNNNTREVMCARVGRGKNRIFHGGVNNVTAGNAITLTSGLVGATWLTSNGAIAAVNNGTVTRVANGSAIITAYDGTTEESWYVVCS